MAWDKQKVMQKEVVQRHKSARWHPPSAVGWHAKVSSPALAFELQEYYERLNNSLLASSSDAISCTVGAWNFKGGKEKDWASGQQGHGKLHWEP